MRTVAPITEQFQHFVGDLKESFWGDVYGQTRGVLEKFLSAKSVRLRDRFVGCGRYEQEGGRRGLEGKNLLLVVTDGCAGLAAALQTVYPRVPPQRCWVQKMRNLCEPVRRRDHDAVKRDAQQIYRAASLAMARRAFLQFRWNWRAVYPGLVRRRFNED